MIKEFSGRNLLYANTDAIVIPVNCLGISGVSLVQKFKKLFPKNFQEYKMACRKGLLTLGGKPFFSRYQNQVIVNFPVMGSAIDQVNLCQINKSLWALKETLVELGCKSVAMPWLIRGHDPLDLKILKSVIEHIFETKHNIEVHLYGR